MRIGQKIKEEKIGTLTHGGGIISLTPSTVNVGGVQVDTDALSKTISLDVILSANTLYMIYIVLNVGAPEIKISTNVNSIGPAGFSSWKLVGAFYSNGVVRNEAIFPIITITPTFGSFVNIIGTPQTDWVSETLRIVDNVNANVMYLGSTPNYGRTCRWKRDGNNFIFEFGYYQGTPNVGVAGSGNYAVMFPQNIPAVDGGLGGGNSGNLTYIALDFGGGSNFGQGRWGAIFSDRASMVIVNQTGGLLTSFPGAHLSPNAGRADAIASNNLNFTTTNYGLTGRGVFNITSWSTQIKDL